MCISARWKASSDASGGGNNEAPATCAQPADACRCSGMAAFFAAGSVHGVDRHLGLIVQGWSVWKLRLRHLRLRNSLRIGDVSAQAVRAPIPPPPPPCSSWPSSEATMRRRSLYRTTRSRCLTRRNDGLRSMPVRSSTELAASGENAATDSIFLSRVRRSSSQQIAPYPLLAIALRVPVVPHDSETSSGALLLDLLGDLCATLRSRPRSASRFEVVQRRVVSHARSVACRLMAGEQSPRRISRYYRRSK